MAIKREIKKDIVKKEEKAVKSLEDIDVEDAIKAFDDLVEEVEEDEKIRWRLKSGSLYLADGRHFEAGQTFWAYENEINKAFRDTVVPADPIAQIKAKKAVIKFHKAPIEVTDEEKEKEDYVPMFNVANVAGDAINPSPLNEKDANKLLSVLNGR